MGTLLLALPGEFGLAALSQLIVFTRWAARVAWTLLAHDPAALFQAMQGWIQRAFLEAEMSVRPILHVLNDA